MRTFVAIEINSEDVLGAIKKIQTELTIRAKPVSLDNIHFTLMFLGEVSEKIAEKIQGALNLIRFESFDVEFTGIGAFPKARIPRVIWVGTDKNGGEQLSNLALQVENALSQFGFHSDKPFQPHVTIFRIKNKIENVSDKLEKYKTMKFGVQKVSEIKFKKSVLTPEGPNYSDLQVIKAK